MEFSTKIGEKELVVKTGELAKRASGSCVVQYGETTVLGTVVLGEENKELNYFPLSVEYEEKFYAAGRIKGSRFIKRETRPADEAVLTGRMIDRAIRPLFDGSMRRNVQIILTVLSVDEENDADMVAFYAACICLSISEIPWQGPISGIRACLFNSDSEENQIILNPTYEERAKSILDLVVCGTSDRVVMLEAVSDHVSKEQVFETTKFAASHLDEINKFITSIQSKIGKEKISIVSHKKSSDSEENEEEDAKAKVKKMTEEIVNQEVDNYIFKDFLKTRQQRVDAIEGLKAKVDEVLLEKQIGKDKRKRASEHVYELVYKYVSTAILDNNRRIDGRQLDEVRKIDCQVGILPRVHGTGLFSRGETQVLSIITLGAPGLEQYLDTMEEVGKKRFMHHYNFPPFCTGEARHMRFTSRREIGHSSLAEKGMQAVVPAEDKFPYTIRIVSEVLSSNGSSSMASACAAVLASMDAGVPIKNPVSGIAIGLASEENDKGIKRYKVITDIQDLEDGPGGMDFKVVGTKDKITSIQMDTKTKGITFDIIKEALEHGDKARESILNDMAKALPETRDKLATSVPKIKMFKINPDKIRVVIGAGGKTINKIIEETESEIDIEQDGTVFVTSKTDESLKRALDWINDITREFKVGEEFTGEVMKILDFGAFVNIAHGHDGLVHVSKMSDKHVKHPEDIVKIGDKVKVKITEIDRQGRINLTMKLGGNK
ncbi:polyribonucleotide nucleotidyltransferase [Patescibacteria group bacterium]|nr:polyribonucleotide nucleotidyltransferase [Patescibacteria group bacterium]